MVTHQTASPITANACGRSLALTFPSRSVASRIAMTAQESALSAVPGATAPPCSQFSVPHFGWPAFPRFQFSLFHATRQRAEQNLACSRLGSNVVPQRTHCLLSAIQRCYA
jgi:hypothetical protein